MQEQLIGFETAKLAKEKGFDIYQSKQYAEGVNPNTLFDYNYNQCILFNDVYYAPTQSLLQKWLREKHNIIVTVDICNGEKNEKIFFSKIYVTGVNPKYKNEFSLLWTSDFFIIYEEAFEEVLKYSLTLIKI